MTCCRVTFTFTFIIIIIIFYIQIRFIFFFEALCIANNLPSILYKFVLTEFGLTGRKHVVMNN